MSTLEILQFGRYYLKEWGYNVVFQMRKDVIIGKWGEYSRRRMLEGELLEMYEMIKKVTKSQPRIVALVTGEYQEERDGEYNIVVDIDKIETPDPNGVKNIAKRFAKRGYVVSLTRRGLHLHAKTKDRIYALTVVDSSETSNPVRVGEGASLQAHLWASPPSVRRVESNWIKYKFVLPDGSLLGRFDRRKLKNYDPPLVSFKELSEDIENELGYRIIKYDFVGERIQHPLPSEPVKKRAVFLDLEDFIAKMMNFMLPLPIAIVMYNYLKCIDHPFSTSIIYRYPVIRDNELIKIKQGSRFLVSAEVVLFLSHLVEYITFDQVNAILKCGIENYPEDSGAPLDRKIKYLVLISKEGYLYPRYSGLGSLRPVTYCKECIYYHDCIEKRRSPWTTFRIGIERLLGIQ